jgi:hypothetical protein
MGDRPNENYAGCCKKVYPHLVAWEGVGEDTKKSCSACLREISQNAKKKKNYDKYAVKNVHSSHFGSILRVFVLSNA